MQFLFLTFLLLTIAISLAHTLLPSLVDNFSGFRTTLWRYNLKQGNSSDPDGYRIFQSCHCLQSSSNMTFFRSLIHLLKNPRWLLLFVRVASNHLATASEPTSSWPNCFPLLQTGCLCPSKIPMLKPSHS